MKRRRIQPQIPWHSGIKPFLGGLGIFAPHPTVVILFRGVLGFLGAQGICAAPLDHHLDQTRPDARPRGGETEDTGRKLVVLILHQPHQLVVGAVMVVEVHPLPHVVAVRRVGQPERDRTTGPPP
eukprot:1194694-Prorocentrum_minimum.AAC.9